MVRDDVESGGLVVAHAERCEDGFVAHARDTDEVLHGGLGVGVAECVDAGVGVPGGGEVVEGFGGDGGF